MKRNFYTSIARNAARGQWLVFTRRKRQFITLDGVEIVIEAECLDEFRILVESTPANELAARWGVSTNTLHRIREALGLAGTYEGDSRVTRWRRGKESDADTNNPS